jgi:hypothetical protein
MSGGNDTGNGVVSRPCEGAPPKEEAIALSYP